MKEQKRTLEELEFKVRLYERLLYVTVGGIVMGGILSIIRHILGALSY